MTDTFICSHCGQEHAGLPRDWGYQLPDVVHQLNYLARYTRSRSNRDLCTLDDTRYFFRALLSVRLLEGGEDAYFNWGLWVEVDQATHDLYLRSWDEDISHCLGRQGRLANDVKVHPGTIGLPVTIHFQAGSARPLLKFAPDVEHGLAQEQRNGISAGRHHDILLELGHFSAAGAA